MSEPNSIQPVQRLIHAWQRQSDIHENVVAWHDETARPARWEAFPVGVNLELRRALSDQGIEQLYSHQAQSIEMADRGGHFVVTTGTASGKTLCYNLPVVNQWLKDPNTRALYLFPTKALAQDQISALNQLLAPLNHRPAVSVYDGDTPSSVRGKVRSAVRIMMTNPDMLHISILPHHTLWADFFRNLRFVVIDEIHMYRGVFGSHLANLIRRLKRIAKFYGAAPQFFMTSATIGNPVQLAERLIEEKVAKIDQDGAPRGARHLLLYNPPVVLPDLGIRRGASTEAVRLAGDLLAYQVQLLIFTRSRRSVEIILRNLRDAHPAVRSKIHGYRSGYLARERRAVEQDLRSGQARAVVTTNALELGVDIGHLDATVLVGYPGTIAATRQQAGRAGRHAGDALAVFIASASPLDQFLMKHPEYIFDQSPEQALIDANNLLILLAHLRCAAFELPYFQGDAFGRAPQDLVQGLLQALENGQELHFKNGRYFWTADQYPSNQISLRTASEAPVMLQAEDENGRLVTIGEVDDSSARWMVHPNAIYIHQGQEYEVQELDLERKHAYMHRVEVDYYTEAVQNVTIEKIELLKQAPVPGGTKNFGEILVTSQVKGYRRMRWGSMEVLGEGLLELPPTTLRTTSFWLELSDNVVDHLREAGQWNNDANVYGADWNRQRSLARQRDGYTCQACGQVEQTIPFHVHHKVPFRQFSASIQANQLENLVTLCPACHQKAEQAIRMRSGLAGLGYALHHLAPLFLMCDINDLGLNSDVKSPLADGQPAVAIYDMAPAGIGLSERLFDLQSEVLAHAHQLVSTCACRDGCPGCVGPAGENGMGGKAESLALLQSLLEEPYA